MQIASTLSGQSCLVSKTYRLGRLNIAGIPFQLLLEGAPVGLLALCKPCLAIIQVQWQPAIAIVWSEPESLTHSESTERA